MTNKKSLLIANITSLTFGQISNLVINFISISLTARYLGVENFGLFNYILAIVVISSKLIDFGFSQILFKSLSVEKSDISLLNTALTLRFIIYVACCVLLNILLVIFDSESVNFILLNLIFFNIIISQKFANFREILDIPFKVNHRMHISVVITLIDNVVFLILILLYPIVNGGIFYVVFSYTVSNLPGFLITIILLKKKYGYFFRPSLYKFRWLLNESLPLFGYVLLFNVFQQIDTLLLKYLSSDYDVGIYSAAMRLTIPFGILPYALITTLYPVLAIKNKNENSEFYDLSKMIFRILFFSAFIIAVIGSFKVEQILNIIFGVDYLKSATSTVLLFISQIFLFHNYFSVDFLTIRGEQKYNFIYSLIILIVNVALLFYLIPKMGNVGAGTAKLTATILGTLYFVSIFNKLKTPINYLNFKTLIWALVSILFVYILSYILLVVYLVLSLIMMLFLIFLLKNYTTYEIDYLLKLVGKEKWRKFFVKN